MYCLAKFCCICFKRNKNILLSVNYKSKDNIQLLDKIVCCIPEFQVVFNKIPDARICINCRDQISRTYNMITKTKRNLNILLGYVENLSKNNFTATGSILNVDLNGPNKKKIRPTVFNNTETNDKTELANIIEETVNSSENESIDIKSVVELKYFNNEEYKIEETYEVEIKSESSIKNEPLYSNEDEEHSLPEFEVSIKEDRLSPVNPNILSKLLEDDEDIYSDDTLPLPEADIFNDDTVPLTKSVNLTDDILQLPEPDRDDTDPLLESVEQNTTLEEPNTIVEECSNSTDKLNTTQEAEKRKKPSQFPCPLCKNYFSNNAMARHLVNQHNKNRFNCSVCNMSFKSEMVLKKHLGIHLEYNKFDVWKLN